MPREFVVTDDLPRTPTGKLVKGKLRERYAEGVGMSDLEVALEDGALWLTLNRPEQFNALTGEMVVGAGRGAARRRPRATTYAWWC